MRKDVKIGMLIGTGLCLVAAVWFCMYQQVVAQPRIEDLLFPKKENILGFIESSKFCDLIGQIFEIEHFD